MIDDRQAKETFVRKWRECISGQGYYEDESLCKEIAWEQISKYWRRECTRLRKSRRDAIVVWCLERLMLLGPVSVEDFKKTVKELVDRAIWEA